MQDEVETKNGTRFVKREIDNNISLRIFWRREAVWEMPHPAAVKAFIEELREAFGELKQHLVSNGSHPDPVEFEYA